MGIAAHPAALALFFPAFLLTSLAMGFNAPLYYAMVSDSIDYSTAQTGVRMVGIAYAVNSLMVKVPLPRPARSWPRC